MTSAKLLETVSAAVDDEAGEFELRRMLDEAARTPELRDAWERQHAVSAALRGEWRAGGEALRARVRDALRAETATAAGSGAALRKRHWRRGLAAAAVAAGIAAAAMVAVQTPQDAAEPGAVQLAVEAPLGSDAAVVDLQAPLTPEELEAQFTPEDMERLNAYLMHHVQYKAMHHPGVSSFAKFVSYPVQTSEDR